MIKVIFVCTIQNERNRFYIIGVYYKKEKKYSKNKRDIVQSGDNSLMLWIDRVWIMTFKICSEY